MPQSNSRGAKGKGVIFYFSVCGRAHRRGVTQWGQGLAIKEAEAGLNRCPRYITSVNGENDRIRPYRYGLISLSAQMVFQTRRFLFTYLTG